MRWVLSHRAGLPAIRKDFTLQALYNWRAVTDTLAEIEPWWEPGTQHGYHAMTFGHLIGEVIRRITGKSVGQFFHAEVTGPLGADFFIGVPEAADARTAEVIPDPPPLPGDTTMWEVVLRDPTFEVRMTHGLLESSLSDYVESWADSAASEARGLTHLHAFSRALSAISACKAWAGPGPLSAVVETSVPWIFTETSRRVQCLWAHR